MGRELTRVARLAGWSLALWLLALPVAAAPQGMLQGELGRWLDGVAAELGETLSRHPRFSGETVRLVTLTPGSADGGGNALAEAVERRLRQRLLAVDGVRLALDRPRRDCEPPRQIGYLVRIEVTGSGRDGRVHVAVVDVAESLWVSGISHQWQGRLSGAERAALDRQVPRGQPGTPGSPIPLDNVEDVAAAVKADLACTLPRELDGALYVVTPESPTLSRVSLALQGDLMFEPLAAVTADRQEARWLLTLEAAPDGTEVDGRGADVRVLNATLSDARGGGRQQLAAVYVSGPWQRRAGVAPAPAVGVPAAEPSPAPGPGLLSGLEVRPARAEGICDHRKARVNSCVEIAFELRDPAYVFVVSTRGHRLAEAPCGSSLEKSDAGARRFRMRVPPGRFAVEAGDTGPDAGFYVLAARDRDVAERLLRALGRAPGQCERPAASAADWLAELDAVLRRHGNRVSWQATHLVHDTGGIVAL